jgi:hypothetical protein
VATETSRPPSPATPAPPEELAPHGVQHQIDRADPLEPAVTVEHLLGAQLAGRRERRRRYGGHHLGAAPARQLGREPAHPTDRPADQHPLPGLGATVAEQALPGAEGRQRDRRALDVAEPGSTEAHLWHDALALVRDQFSSPGHCTHEVKHHPAADGPLACEFHRDGDVSVDPG